jgi:endoglucanase
MRQRSLAALTFCMIAAPLAAHAEAVRVADLDFLPGVNLSGAEFHANARFPDPENVSHYLDLGMRLIRLPVSWSRVQPVPGGDLESDQLAEVDRIVEQATGRGAFVALDIHSYMRHGIDPTGSDVVGEPGSGISQAHFADLWSKLAARYADNPRVIFNLMNEPHGMDTALVVENQNAAIAAIRALGAENIVLVSANHYSGAHSFGWSDNPDHMDGFEDPIDNFAFDLHQYLDPDASGTKPDCAFGSGGQRLAAATTWLRAQGHRAILGEFNTGPGSDCMVELADMLDHMAEHDDVWFGWAYWAGGGLWRGADANDPFTLDPHPEGHPVPQLAVLRKYLDEEAR